MKYLFAILTLLLTLSVSCAQETQSTVNASEEDVLLQVVLGSKDATPEDMKLAYKVVRKRLQFLNLEDIELAKFDKKRIVLFAEPYATETIEAILPSLTEVGGLDFSLLKAESVDVAYDELTVSDLQEATFDETDIETVDVLLSEYSGKPELLVTIKESSQDEFESFTEANIRGLLVISSGDVILMSPMIQGALRESAVISGSNLGLVEDAEGLALSVFSGRLPIKLDVLEFGTVARAKVNP